jgi:hypothetical protein
MSDAEPAVDHGLLLPWRQADLPEPLPYSAGNVLRTIGPGAILLAGAIGGGEWIIGPLMAVRYGPGILWIATVGIVLQTLFNLEAVRYTLYTGEPILTGVMRLAPGPRFWAPCYILLGVAQLATPAIAAGCAVVLFAAAMGRMPTESETDSGLVSWIGVGVILTTVALLLSGKSIERLLEKLSWGMILFIFVFLTAVNGLFVPAETSLTTLQGFLVPQPLPANVSLVLLGVFAATAGSGGMGNLAITNWFRDKGFAMGSHVGGIAGALAENHRELPAVGVTFPVTPENLRRWHGWWRYARIDQQWLWGVGCLLGMYLNVNLALAIVPAEAVAEIEKGYNSGAFQAEHLARQFWSGLWWLTLLNGFWILFSTHLGNTDVLVRTTADILWAASPRCRKWPISRIYAATLLLLTCWALFAIHFGNVISLFSVLGIVAGPILALSAVLILRVNSRFLPRELRPPLWRQIALMGSVLAYGGMSAAMIYSKIAN